MCRARTRAGVRGGLGGLAVGARDRGTQAAAGQQREAPLVELDQVGGSVVAQAAPVAQDRVEHEGGGRLGHVKSFPLGSSAGIRAGGTGSGQLRCIDATAGHAAAPVEVQDDLVAERPQPARDEPCGAVGVLAAASPGHESQAALELLHPRLVGLAQGQGPDVARDRRQPEHARPALPGALAGHPRADAGQLVQRAGALAERPQHRRPDDAAGIANRLGIPGHRRRSPRPRPSRRRTRR